MAVTLKQIAARCGVSALTVSDILNDKPKPYAATTKAKVKAMAAELGYRPNAAARAIARQRHARIGVLEHSFKNASWLPQALVEGMLDGCEQAELDLSISRSSEEGFSDPTFVPRIMREWCVDGLLVNINYAASPALDELCQQHGLPALWLNCQRTDNCIYGDDRGAARALTEYLLAAGYRDLRYYGGAVAMRENHYSKLDRPGGYEDAMRAAGLEPMTILTGSGRTETDLRAALLGSLGGERPPVWLAYSPAELSTMLGLLIGTEARVGVDLHLASFTASGEMAQVCIAQMRQPLETIGRQAVADLVKLIADPTRRQAPSIVPWALHPGDLA
ncbi:MAG: LacI family DNA-binding transcriptional regulator [Planctomycetota bacterium]|jgi:LacI family transcriptional regulator|nr:LacI family DNA-binding transcriptional regulator [Planctomycetota bacterium]